MQCVPRRRTTTASQPWSPQSCPAGRSRCVCRRPRTTGRRPQGRSLQGLQGNKESQLMFITKKAVDRRLFLRGLGATLALPFLDAMAPAFAATRKAIPRMSFMYIPNGANIAAWTPTGVGKDFVFSPTLKSLEPFRERLNV